jgi:hypothetical protein
VLAEHICSGDDTGAGPTTWRKLRRERLSAFGVGHDSVPLILSVRTYN